MKKEYNNIQPFTSDYQALFSDVCAIIDGTGQQLAAAYTNYQLLMYWSIGSRINHDILGGKRAEYGAQIVSTLSTQLTWNHVNEILPLKEAFQREFYLTMALKSHRTF